MGRFGMANGFPAAASFNAQASAFGRRPGMTRPGQKPAPFATGFDQGFQQQPNFNQNQSMIRGLNMQPILGQTGVSGGMNQTPQNQLKSIGRFRGAFQQFPFKNLPTGQLNNSVLPQASPQ